MEEPKHERVRQEWGRHGPSFAIHGLWVQFGAVLGKARTDIAKSDYQYRGVPALGYFPERYNRALTHPAVVPIVTEARLLLDQWDSLYRQWTEARDSRAKGPDIVRMKSIEAQIRNLVESKMEPVIAECVGSLQRLGQEIEEPKSQSAPD